MWDLHTTRETSARTGAEADAQLSKACEDPGQNSTTSRGWHGGGAAGYYASAGGGPPVGSQLCVASACFFHVKEGGWRISVPRACQLRARRRSQWTPSGSSGSSGSNGSHLVPVGFSCRTPRAVAQPSSVHPNRVSMPEPARAHKGQFAVCSETRMKANNGISRTMARQSQARKRRQDAPAARTTQRSIGTLVPTQAGSPSETKRTREGDTEKVAVPRRITRHLARYAMPGKDARPDKDRTKEPDRTSSCRCGGQAVLVPNPDRP
ncbi:hypothetical protein BGZ61DRAFT_477895 [Ilyonectria robusta]|uniref:uncharacterized protein n=1 Tax=Ilyonectria robusta TaxID=1079257 RepID=UPI001E8E14F7|nr:uncharacterized protein BGZ61DRAFT_477895 [Ilyonectria robusta]KAH8699946.1 hypothetical protein BGZ61DRAFT_477895 [Ilyonectria robusta]